MLIGLSAALAASLMLNMVVIFAIGMISSALGSVKVKITDLFNEDSEIKS